MSTTGITKPAASYSLGHAPAEYARLQAQACVWEAAATRILDQVSLPEGASCLDAGCGPGETMRLLAQRVGPAGHVLGVDADAAIGALAVETLHGQGYRHCAFQAYDLTADDPVPGGPFDLVYARLLLFHLPERVAVLARLWDAVAPGGYLVVQDYDLRSVSVLPGLASVDEVGRVIIGSFDAAGADVSAGARLAELFDQSGIGVPGGTDVSGRIEPLGVGHRMLESVFRSLLPVALAQAITTEDAAAAALVALDADATRFADRPLLWPLMIGAWKHKEQRGPRDG